MNQIDVNPNCQECGNRTHKLGKLATRKRILQRYRCVICGKTFFIEIGKQKLMEVTSI